MRINLKKSELNLFNLKKCAKGLNKILEVLEYFIENGE
jgi:hypothetical protein